MRQRSADAHLVPVFLENAQGFLRAGSEGPEPEAWAPRAQMLCCAIELALKAALIANGWTDDQNRREIRHDLMRGLKAATGAGAEGAKRPDAGRRRGAKSPLWEARTGRHGDGCR